jgi:hypothetical protein
MPKSFVYYGMNNFEALEWRPMCKGLKINSVAKTSKVNYFLIAQHYIIFSKFMDEKHLKPSSLITQQ